MRWWWLSPTRASYRADDPAGWMRRSRPLLGEHAERVVHRLTRDGADLGADDLLDVVGGAVRPRAGGAQDGQPLRRDLHAVLPQ